ADPQRFLAQPALFQSVLVSLGTGDTRKFLAPGAEVAPFGLVPSQFREKATAVLASLDKSDIGWTAIPNRLPYPSFQNVKIDGSIVADGTLSAKVHYALRGDNEMLLRSAFHRSPKEKQSDVAQLMALADGFRGKIVSVNASDPYDTQKPFTVDYEITQPK